MKLATLNGIATGRDYAIDGGFDQLSDEVVEVRSEGEEGPWIFRIPDELAEALRSASDDLLTAIAREWAATEEWELDGVPADDLAPLLRDLAALARRAEPPRRLYLWMSL